jgi:hypothetical protein
VSTNQPRKKKDWTLVVGGSVFILAGLFALAMPHAMIPAYLQTGGYEIAIHWVIVAYVRLVEPTFLLTIITCMILFAAIFVRAAKKKRWVTPLLAFGLSVLAVVMSVDSSLSRIGVGYKPISSLKTIDSNYHLGINYMGSDSTKFWVVSKCDRWNFLCEYRGITEVKPFDEDDLFSGKNAHLEYDQNKRLLLIRTLGRSIPARGFNGLRRLNMQ